MNEYIGLARKEGREGGRGRKRKQGMKEGRNE